MFGGERRVRWCPATSITGDNPAQLEQTVSLLLSSASDSQSEQLPHETIMRYESSIKQVQSHAIFQEIATDDLMAEN